MLQPTGKGSSYPRAPARPALMRGVRSSVRVAGVEVLQWDFQVILDE
jgi:hypothetical protein